LGDGGGATAVRTHAPLHDNRRRTPGTAFLCAPLCLSFVISLVHFTYSWDWPRRRAKWEGCNVPPPRTGKEGKNIRRHDLDGSNASKIKLEKIRNYYISYPRPFSWHTRSTGPVTLFSALPFSGLQCVSMRRAWVSGGGGKPRAAAARTAADNECATIG